MGMFEREAINEEQIHALIVEEKPHHRRRC
jgi:hypothetical protein